MLFSGVSVFYPSIPQAATNLKNATLFTRINAIATPEDLQVALEATPALQNTFCHSHLNNILVFDCEEEEHSDHVSTVLQMFKDRGMKASRRLCAFTKPSWAEAGFQISPVGGKNGSEAFMVVLLEHIAPDAREDAV